MDEPTVSAGQLAAASKQFMRRMLTIGDNRLELLTVEVQEERERLLRTILIAFGVAAFGLLAAIAITAAIVLLLRAYSPVVTLLTLAALYITAAVVLCRRLIGQLYAWEILPATLDQLRKDRACLEKTLE